jgi:hypothetical protein
MSLRANLLLSAAAFFLTLSAFAQGGKAQAGILTGPLTDGYVPIYGDAESKEVIWKGKLGQPFACVTKAFGLRDKTSASGGWISQENNGRVRIVYFREGRPFNLEGWVQKENATLFRYECGCGRNGDDPCSPLTTAGGILHMHDEWNSCFNEALEKKQGELNGGTATTAQAQPQTSVEDRLKKLEDLKKKGLITPEEYDKKRAEILKNF